MKEILEKQRHFFNSNQTKSISFRIEQLQKLKTLLISNQNLLDKAIYADFKKSPFETFTNEFGLVYLDIDEACKKLKSWSKRKRVGTNWVNFPAKSYIIPEPLGVSLIIGAWNYPYQLSFAPAIAAIAAGNTVILKPSELPSNTSKLMAELINTHFDAAFFHVVEGGIDETTALLEQRFDKIFFTGSPTVGRVVYQAAAKHLTPVTLELGGKSPAIFTEGANLKMGIKRLIWAKFLNAGQTCIAPDYILLPKSLKDEFLRLAKAEIEQAKYSVENGNYVQIINSRNVERLSRLIDPEKIYSGGKVDETTRFIEPTLMHNVSFDDAIMQEEIFGPILPVLTYDSLNEAILEVKKREKPLSCYIFTNDSQLKNKLLNELSFGGGAVNEAIMHIANSRLPFGGVGNSGTGSYHGEAGFKTFSHYKSILEKGNWFETKLKYSPYSEGKLNWIKRLMGIR
ncbi:aldehyde dehydrogenase [Fluviicola taffensis]|uniref:Aldehyde dehydrogenase n=1 Tax=Fluviicola taffensis (strain DSM 16823 / NCIMB 13979 / RW262) TaxID=755732 RepID=F2IK04_FLUTR|nr:aldehyde dehydrogenase [Fluviicola taffensis]AEA45063.1 Aldehyde Dehydrogenase [Fluviicola taffensis DSM 16823]